MARPQITLESKNILVQKLEPYLKSGLSLKKACSYAQVSRSTVYYLMDKDEEFLDTIRRFEQYLSVIISNALTKQLLVIVKKQNEGKELSRIDLRFLQWMALHNNQLIEEYGRRNKESVYDPEAELHRIFSLIEENTDEENNFSSQHYSNT